MYKKTFKYENKNKKKIRLRDILMLLSVFSLCLITVISTSDVTPETKKTSEVTKLADNTAKKAPEQVVEDVKYENTTPKTTSVAQMSYQAEPELNFISPVNGAIIKPFSKTELVYSQTMDDWRTHPGVDIACPYGTDVVSAERGEVKSIEYNINLGNTVKVESGEYTLVYTSLSTNVFVNVGDKLSKGDMIGKTSDSCISEICDEPHFHFEVIKNNEHINPLDIINFN